MQKEVFFNCTLKCQRDANRRTLSEDATKILSLSSILKFTQYKAWDSLYVEGYSLNDNDEWGVG